MGIDNKDKLVTGDSKIDFEHIQILSTLEQLQDMTMPQYARIGTCEKLLHYISDHCRDEEDLMRFHEFPGMEDHKQHHRNLQDSFLKLLSNFIKTGSGNEGSKIHAMFYDHIINIDIPMLRYVKHKTDNLPK